MPACSTPSLPRLLGGQRVHQSRREDYRSAAAAPLGLGTMSVSARGLRFAPPPATCLCPFRAARIYLRPGSRPPARSRLRLVPWLADAEEWGDSQTSPTPEE